MTTTTEPDTVAADPAESAPASPVGSMAASDTAAEPGRADDPGERRPSPALGVFLVFLLLGTLANAAAVYWLWQGSEGLQNRAEALEQQAAGLAGLQASTAANEKTLVEMGRQTRSQWQDLQQQLRQLQQREEQTLEQLALLATSNTVLREKVEAGAAAWRLDAVEQLLLTANERLRLAMDVRGAEQALALADEHLQAINDPGWLELRQQIANEIATLRAVPTLDSTALNLKLQALDQRVEGWPLLGHERAQGEAVEIAAVGAEPAADAVWHEQLLHKVSSAILALVTVRQVEAPTAPLLPPDQHGRLIANLRLQFEQARTSLLLRDAAHYQAALRAAADWIGRYFVRDDPAVQAALSTLSELRAVDVAPRMPDISHSLQMLRQLRAAA